MGGKRQQSAGQVLFPNESWPQANGTRGYKLGAAFRRDLGDCEGLRNIPCDGSASFGFACDRFFSAPRLIATLKTNCAFTSTIKWSRTSPPEWTRKKRVWLQYGSSAA